MLTQIVGQGSVFDVGEEYEVPNDIGRAWCSEPKGEPRAVAVAVKREAKRETRAA